MKAGFGRVDITPRLGVEMAGYGPYIHRYAREVRDRLYARALAVSDGSRKWVLMSADLTGLDDIIVRETRHIVSQRTGLSADCVMLHAIHTHSAPSTLRKNIGWGVIDEPYVERLPALLAKACCQALENLQEAEFSHAEVPAEGIAFNRVLEKRPDFLDALRDDWRPEHPELTDRTAQVIPVRSGNGLLGFLSYFSCHPVVCGEATYSIHGDYCGVATNQVEKDYPGAVGMFLQGALGDINPCICHMPQAESMHGLKVIAGRYAGCIRAGIAAAKPLGGSKISATLKQFTFKRRRFSKDELRADIKKHLEVIRNDPGGEEGWKCRMNTVFAIAKRRLLATLEAGGTLDTTSEIQLLRLGNLLLLGTPFELFRGIKEHILREIKRRPLFVLSRTNDSLGYAPARKFYEGKEGTHFSKYSLEVAPLISGSAPFTPDIEDEIVRACVELINRDSDRFSVLRLHSLF